MSASARYWWATIAALRRAVIAAAGLLLIAPVVANAAIGPPGLSPGEKKDLNRIESYLNGLGTIRSRFVQANPDGSYSEGTMYLQRPGNLRVEYDSPDPYLIISSGKWFIYVDKELQEATYLPVEKTPAYFIVKKNIRFGGQLRVVSYKHQKNVLQVEVEKVDEPDAGRVMLIFTDGPLQLRKWQVIDAQGNLTDTTLINPNFDVPINSRLFEYTGPPPSNSN